MASASKITLRMAFVGLLGTALALPALLVACGTDAVGVESCRKLEYARCERAPGCGISLAKPPHEGAPDEDVAACKRYYKDACLHGLVSETEPGEIEIEACRVAIESGTCDVVINPAQEPACVFLNEEPPVPDAGAEDASDASTDGSLGDLLDGQSPF